MPPYNLIRVSKGHPMYDSFSYCIMDLANHSNNGFALAYVRNGHENQAKAMLKALKHVDNDR